MENKSEKIRYFLYARRSSESEDKQMASIESQIDELQRLAKKENLQIVEVLPESKSAKEPGRAVFNQMLKRIYDGEANGILCWKLNRLARNPIDGGQISWMLQQGTIQCIQTYGRAYRPEDNVITMQVELGMANQYIRDLSVDTKRGMRQKANRGWCPTALPLGYLHNPLKKDGLEIIKDPERWDLVGKMFHLMLTGDYNPNEIHQIATKQWGLKNRYGGPISRSTVYRLFTEPFYFGDYEYPKRSGNWFHGLHEPIITPEEYDVIQTYLGRKGKPRPKTHKFAFTGAIRCKECGCMVTAEEKKTWLKKGHINIHTYYHCTKRKGVCSQPSIKEDELERQILEVLTSIEIPSEFTEWALDFLKAENEKEFRSSGVILENLQKQYTLCLRRIDNLIDMRANQEITPEDFKRKQEAALEEKDRIKKLLSDTDTRVNEWMVTIEKGFNFAEKARERFENGSLEEKHQILVALGQNITMEDGKLSIELQKPLIQLKKISPAVRTIHKRLESAKKPINKKELGVLYTQNPIVLPG